MSSLPTISLATPSSTIVSPATRRNTNIFAESPLNSPALSHVVNDDTAEKRRRRKSRLSDIAQRHMGSPASESRTKSVSGAITTGWNASQLTEHLLNCIQLSRENKINTKNAFSLHLIDTMNDILSREAETNFQLAGSSLEAGAKIYSSRVDALHIQAIQVHDQVSQLETGQEGPAGVGDMEGESGSQAAGEQGQRKRIRKKKRVIETDIDKINIANVERMHEIDPLLQKLSKEGDSSFGGLLLAALRCSDDDCALMLDSNCSAVPPTDWRKHDRLITDHDIPTIELVEELICPTFNAFEFNSSRQHPIFAQLDSRDDEMRYDPDKEISINALPDDFDHDDDDGDAGAMEEEPVIDYIGGSGLGQNTATTKLTDGTFSSLLSMVDGSSGDYGFFGGMKNMWAGPSHWKPGFAGQKRVATTVSSDGSTKRAAGEKKQQFVIDFDEEIDFSKKFKKTRAATTVTKTTLERYNKHSLLLPEDLHYNPKQLLKLSNYDNIQVELQQDGAVDSQQSTEAQSDDVYDYSNKNDVDNFCPDLSLGGAEHDDEDDDDIDGFPSQAEMPSMLSIDGMMVAQPKLVEKISLQYAKRPKKVDFKRLKRNMWSLITEPDSNKENLAESEPPPVHVKESVSFADMFTKLPTMCPSHEAKDLSMPIAFVALLHMCNEKNLALETLEGYSDLRITAGER